MRSVGDRESRMKKKETCKNESGKKTKVRKKKIKKKIRESKRE